MVKQGRPRSKPDTKQSEAAREASSRWYKANKERVKTVRELRLTRDGDKIRLQDRLRRQRVRKEAIQRLGGQCECCGLTVWEFLAIDHRYNDGAAERASGAGASRTAQLVRQVANPKERYRLLCHNCNMALDFYSYCPHQAVQRPVRRLASPLHASYEEAEKSMRRYRRLTVEDKVAIRQALAGGSSVSSQSRKYHISRGRVISIREGADTSF
jgi:hypothetical protein